MLFTNYVQRLHTPAFISNEVFLKEESRPPVEHSLRKILDLLHYLVLTRVEFIKIRIKK